MPSHESEALEDKQKLQMKTFSELAECLARIPPKITFYGLLFKYNYVGCLLLLMLSSDLLFAIKRDAYIFRKQDDFVGFRITSSCGIVALYAPISPLDCADTIRQ